MLTRSRSEKHGAAQIGFRKDQQEFLPADAPREIRSSKALPHPFPETRQDDVSCPMAVLVVDLLEMIDVDED